MAKRFNHERTYRTRIWRFYKQAAANVQAIINMNLTPDGRIANQAVLNAQLEAYGRSLHAPATAVWTGIINRQAAMLAKDFARGGLKINNQSASMIDLINRLVAEKVDLITTLPTNAAQEAQRLSAEAALETGSRHETLINKLQGLEPGYPEFAARRLARTEVARSQSELVAAQAKSVGIRQYVWRTVEDERVRDSHAAMEGKICDFDNPPEVEPGRFYNPGGIWNCRCYAEPVLPSVPDE